MMSIYTSRRTAILRRVALAAMTFALPLGLAARAADSLSYSIVDLGTLGGTFIAGTAINADGEVAGNSSVTGDAATYGFLYDATGMHSVGTLGGAQSIADGINADDVDGINADAAVGNIAYMYDSARIHSLGTLGGLSGQANGINNINNTGQITGYSFLQSGNNDHAFLYDSTGMHDIGTLGGDFSVGNASNHLGVVAGASYTANNTDQYAYTYDPTGMHSLAALGGDFNIASGINNSGVVVGEGTLTNDIGLDAFVYINGQMLDLNNLIDADGKAQNWNLFDALGINDAGQITGEEHAFVLTPDAALSVAPLPSTAWAGLVLLGGAFACCVVTRSRSTQYAADIA